MKQTDKLGLPYIITSQAQKEVTHNEALNRLDIFITPIVKDIVNSPPSNPQEGELVIIGKQPSGGFTNHMHALAQYKGGGWLFYAPFKWMDAVVESIESKMVYDGTGWVPFGLIMKDTGEYLRVEHWQEDISLSGKEVSSTLLLPDRSSVMAINVRVLDEIQGSTSFKVGVSGDLARYGNEIGVAKDSTNVGMSYHPITYYQDTAVMLTAVGGDFSGGVVRVTAQYFKIRGAWSW